MRHEHISLIDGSLCLQIERRIVRRVMIALQRIHQHLYLYLYIFQQSIRMQIYSASTCFIPLARIILALVHLVLT